MQTNITDLQWTPMAVTERNRAHFRDNYNVCARMARFQKSTSCKTSCIVQNKMYLFIIFIFLQSLSKLIWRVSSIVLQCCSCVLNKYIRMVNTCNSCRKTKHQQKKVARCHLPSTCLQYQKEGEFTHFLERVEIDHNLQDAVSL